MNKSQKTRSRIPKLYLPIRVGLIISPVIRWMMRATLHRDRDILSNTQFALRPIIAVSPGLARFRTLTDLRDDLLRCEPSTAAVVVHVDVAATTGWSVHRPHCGGSLAECPATRPVAVFGVSLGTASPALECGEDVAQEGPDEGDVGD